MKKNFFIIILLIIICCLGVEVYNNKKDITSNDNNTENITDTIDNSSAEYPEIKHKLDDDHIFLIDSVTENDDNTFTFKGVIAERLKMTKDELEELAKNGKYKYEGISGTPLENTEEFNVRKNYEGYDYAFTYFWNDEERVWMYSKKIDNNMYYINNEGQLTYEWKLTSEYKQIKISADTKVNSDYFEGNLKEYLNEHKDLGNGNKYNYSYNFEFDNDTCVYINECVLSI